MTATNQEVREKKIRDNKYTSKTTQEEMDWSCIENELKIVTKNCANWGTRREKEEGSPQRDNGNNS